MNSKIWIRKALSMCLVVATIATYSMVTLASSERVAGELSILSKNADDKTSFVKVNGEAAQSGRSIFSSSTIVTPNDSGAIINIGKIGKIELAPGTTLALSFNEKGISGDLFSGQVTALNASDIVSIKTLDGTVANLKAGESAVANTGKAQDDDTTSDGGNAWIAWAAIIGGAAAAIIIAATTDNNRTIIGSGASVVSPTR